MREFRSGCADGVVQNMDEARSLVPKCRDNFTESPERNWPCESSSSANANNYRLVK